MVTGPALRGVGEGLGEERFDDALAQRPVRLAEFEQLRGPPSLVKLGLDLGEAVCHPGELGGAGPGDVDFRGGEEAVGEVVRLTLSAAPVQRGVVTAGSR